MAAAPHNALQNNDTNVLAQNTTKQQPEELTQRVYCSPPPPPRVCHTPTRAHPINTLSPFAGSFASVLRPQGRLTFHSGSVSIPCDHSRAASPSLKVTVVVCQKSQQKHTTQCSACVCVRVWRHNHECVCVVNGGKVCVCVCWILKQGLSVGSNWISSHPTGLVCQCAFASLRVLASNQRWVAILQVV